MKKLLVVLTAVLVLSGISLAQSYEFSLFGGYALTSVKGATSYEDTWSSYYGGFNPISETTFISQTSKNAPFFGASFSLFFNPSFGIQLSAGFLNADVPSVSDFTFNWRRVSNGTQYSENFLTDGTGTLSSIPVSLNLVARFGNERFQGYVSGGPTLFLNSFEATSAFGFGIEDPYQIIIWPYLYSVDSIDAVNVGLDIPKTSWTGFGGNIGAGFTFYVSPSIGLSLDARYYLCPAKDLPWNFQTGSYDGLLDNLTGFDFTQDNVDYVLGLSDFMTKINPSFFKFTAGLTFRFGN
jgi:hypothetical protein